MPLPEANLTINDGQLGLVPQDTSGVQALIGTCSSGTANEVNEFGDIESMVDELGTGPLVEAAALIFAAGAGPVICVRATTSTAGAAGSVTHVGSGTSVMTVGGAALDIYDVVVLIKTDAAAVTSGLGTFVYSLDGGDNFSDEIALPVAGAYLIPNTGLTITFAAGTLEADDTYSFTTTGPAYNLTNMNTALTALMADPRTWFNVFVIGVPADASATAAIFSALDTALALAASKFRYAMATCQAADVADSLLITAFSALASVYVQVVAGFADVTSPISLASFKRGASFPLCARMGAVNPSEDLGRVATGPLQGVTALYRDEFSTPGLDANRFSTLRTHVGLPGFFITNGRMMCSPSSDFRFVQYRRVMNVAATTVRAAQLQYLNDSFRVDKVTGLILEADARAIEAYLITQLRTTVLQPGWASDVTVQVDRTNNVLATAELKIRYGVVPLGYAKTITGTIGFNNPAIVSV